MKEEKDSKVSTSKEEKKEKVYNVESIYETYFENLNSVKLYFNKFGNLASGEDESIKEKSKEFFDQALSEIKEELKFVENKEDNTLSKEQVETYLTKFARKIKKQPRISPRNYEILSRSSFLMLNNYFEYLIADLLSYYYNKFKNSLNEKEFKFTLKELNEYDSIEEATKDLIVKEVESLIIDKSFNEILEHFEDKLSISLEKELIKWDEIIEIRERRHLIVHNSSVVNKKYISRTKNPFNYKIGDLVHIDKDYFFKSWSQFKLAGQLLIFNCWGNWDKDNIDNAIYEIMIQTFADLNAKNYDLVCKTCKYSEQIEPKNEDQEDYILRIKVNNAISLKKQNKDTEVKKVLKKIKVGTATPIFKIAHNILSDKYDDLEELFTQAIIVDKLIIDSYLEWPIFDFVREKDEINKRLIKTFKD
ncbi:MULTISPECIES: hypothetical protein [unclassified Cellulophaga]|uniref:hypothetical protein n=1 Tax=unclassified Cellulophaga TaxID=2634405 RepID=UPI0026E2D14D|nr:MULTISPECIES: hypothetical protein [unclassified Cellulophaga]MDO6490630.1 hypothetical protein [Cellulophaga sp. 2_MG-2023]MDO6494176.1 hypothetical protein [Cellulophaga sp. 3_MG-2023]